jgi:hypothetical protein
MAVGKTVELLRRHLEEGVVHLQRREDVLAEIGVELHARDALDHRAENVGGNRIVPRVTGREFQWQLADLGDELVEAGAAVPALDALVAIGGVDGGAFLETVGQA